jgi:hypothetical protein
MSATDPCQCTGCVDCEAPAEASGELQAHHCQRPIVHFIDNRCDECHEVEVDEMFRDTIQAIHKQLPTHESREPIL